MRGSGALCMGIAAAACVRTDVLCREVNKLELKVTAMAVENEDT